MPRLRQDPQHKQHKLACARIAAYVEEHFGDYRAASIALGLVHTTLWRSTQRKRYGPSILVCEALADHSGRPVDYWRGRTEQ